MKRSLAALLFALATTCSTAPAPGPQALPQATPEPQRLTAVGHAQRVILVSFDGLSADELQQFPTPAFSAMATHVTRVVPVTPTVTTTTHTAILTGAPPEKTGIVANQFHIAGTPVSRTTMGMEAEITAETLIDAAHRAGKRVGCMTFPTVDATSPRRSADWGLLWPHPVSRSRIIHLSQSDFHPEWMPAGWGAPTPKHPSFSPVMRTRIEWSVPRRTRETVDIVAYDTTDDNVRNYDALYVEHGGTETRLDGNRWFAVSSRLEDGLYGSWSKVLDFPPSLDSMTIYEGAVTRNEGYPEPFVRMIDDEVGFWPGFPDESAVRAAISGGEGIGSDTFIEQSDRLSDFFTRATVLAMRRMPFDILLGYQPLIDESEHQFRMILPTQPRSTPQLLAEAERVRRAAYTTFDRAVTAMTAAIDPARDAIVITGDHGLAAVDTEVRINQLLADWEFASVSDNALTGDTRWAAYATGNVAQLYRFSPPDDSDALVKKLVTLQSPDGAPVFERVDRKTSASHPNAGDLTAYAYPRFTVSATLGEVFTKPLYYGQHGGLNSHHEFDTALGASGAGVFSEMVPAMTQTRIARYICDLLGIAPPKDAE
jgi:predicted AlkP superfamily pyrophosphatase or phosphodiesterase